MTKSSLGLVGLLCLVACGSESDAPDPSSPSTPGAAGAVDPAAVPGAPAVTAAGDDGTVTLTWPTVAGASGYDVARATTSGAETLVKHVTDPSFIDTDVTAETTYFYTVTSVGGGGAGAPSKEVSAKPFSFDVLHMRHDAQVLRGVAAGNGVLIAVGDGMRVIRSTDAGASWTDVNVAGYGSLYSVVYGGGRFVAVGASGQTFTSPDGLTWKGSSSGVSIDLVGVAYGGATNPRFVAIGAAATIVTSADGATWMPVTNNLHHSDVTTFDYRLKSIAYGDPATFDYFMIIAADENGNGGYAFYVDGSGDLGTWAPSPAGNAGALLGAPIDGVTFGKYQGGGAAVPSFHMVGFNGFWAHAEETAPGVLAFGTVSAGSGETWKAIAFDGADTLAIFAESGAKVMTCSISTACKAGMNGWTDQQAATSSGYGAATFAGGKWVGVGSDELVVGGTAGTTLAELHRSSPSFTHLLTKHVAGVGDGVVAAGSFGGRYLYSSDGGTHFASVPAPNNAGLWGAKSIGGKLFMVGDKSTIMSSVTGAPGTWTLATTTPATDALYDIASSGALMVAAGNDGVFTSPDGATWTHQAGPGYQVTRLEWEGTTFVATTSDGRILTTTDGVKWNEALHDDAQGMSLEGIAFEGGTLVVTGREGHVWVSTDHAATFVPHHIADAPALVGLARFHGHWVAGGSKERSELWTSEDAVTWKRRTGIPSTAYSVEVAAGKLFVAGQMGAIYSTPAP